MLILIVFFNDTATTESYTYWHTLSLHVALPISEGFTLATEVADWLSRRGVPFAQAHEITGAVVRLCEERGIELEQLSAADLALVDPRLDISIKVALTPEEAVAARQGYGGTAPARVRDPRSEKRRVGKKGGS